MDKTIKIIHQVKHKLFVVFAFLIVFCSCNTKQVFNDTIDFEDETWSKDSIVSFNVEIADTNALYDVVFAVTNSDDYPFANLYVFTDISSDTLLYLRDTIEFILSSQDGEWLGTGLFGYTNEFNLHSKIHFPKAGTYTFSYEQAMRCTNADCSVNGIQSVSFSLNKN